MVERERMERIAVEDGREQKNGIVVMSLEMDGKRNSSCDGDREWKEEGRFRNEE